MLKKYKFAATPLYGSSCIDDIEKIFLDDLTQSIRHVWEEKRWLVLASNDRLFCSRTSNTICISSIHRKLLLAQRETPYSQLQHLSFLGIKPFPGAIISLFDTKDANIESANWSGSSGSWFRMHERRENAAKLFPSLSKKEFSLTD